MTMLPDNPDLRDSDTACKCTHEPEEHYDLGGYSWCVDDCDCWQYRESYSWQDASSATLP